MTREDYYVALAGVLHGNRPIDGISKETLWEAIVDEIAEVLEDDNPRFDYERFVAACHKG